MFFLETWAFMAKGLDSWVLVLKLLSFGVFGEMHVAGCLKSLAYKNCSVGWFEAVFDQRDVWAELLKLGLSNF